jgi:predicted permease
MAVAGFRSVVVPLHADHVASIRPTLLLLQAGVLFLLLIGGVNVANLLLIRATARTKELAVRQALGASARHVVTEVLVETTLLTAMGGLLGLAVGAGGIRLLGALGADHLPLGAHIAFDARVGLAAFGGAILLGLALAVPIAWYHLRGHSQTALHAEPRGATASRAGEHLRHGFLVVQMALAFVLLAGAGLLGLSLEKVLSVSPGFRPANVSSGHLSLPATSYPDDGSLLAFTERLTADLRGQPGVLAAGVVTNVPLSGNSIKSAVTAEGHVLQRGESLRGHYSYGVTGDYFAALGIPLSEGRFLTADDSRRGERVCVVDEDFARRYWPHGGAVGQRVFQASDPAPDAEAFTVVGVVGAVRQAGLTEDEAQGAVYFPFAHRLDRSLFVVTRASASADAAGRTLQAVVRRIDPELPVDDLRSMEGRIADSLVARRSPALLAGLFSSLAVLLTAIGTYGVLSYAVAQRRREIALRMALGARPEQIRNQFLSLALRLLAAGVVFGIAGAWTTGRAMQALLFQVPPVHAATLAATAAILAVVSLSACLLPSRRAARISPMEALAE